MTVLDATISIDQRARGRVVSDDLIHRLDRPAFARAAGPFVAFFQAIISFGLLPLILWPMRWAMLVDVDRADLLQLIARWRSRVEPGDARQLDCLVRRLRPRPMLMVLPWLVVVFNGLLMGVLLARGDSLDRLKDLTFGHNHHVPLSQDDSLGRQRNLIFDRSRNLWTTNPAGNEFANTTTHIDSLTELETHLFPVWMWGLIFGYACHWYAVRSHAGNVRAVVKWTNRFATAHRLPMVPDQDSTSGLGVMWIVLAVVLGGLNAWWGIPLALGGAMQRQYSRTSSPCVRSSLAHQLLYGLAVRPTVTPTSRFCGGNHCGARLPAVANFCPRCGSAAVSAR